LSRGGWGGGFLSSAELYDVGLGFSAAWQPQIATCASSLSLGSELALTGSGFRGVSEASGGDRQNSPSDYPVVQLRTLENEQTVILQSASSSTNTYTSTPVRGLPAGYALATVFVNGIPSVSRVVSVVDDTPTVTVNATDPLAGETGTGQGSGTFTFTRTGSTAAPLTVNFTVSGTASCGSDYTSLGSTVTFSVGSATATKTVNVFDDNLVEGDETVIVTLASGASYTLDSPSMATVTLQDDDTSVTVAATDPTASELGTGEGTGTYIFTRTGFMTGALTVNFTVGGTVTAGSDYTSLGNSVTFAAGSATATKTVSVIDDALVEDDETVVVSLSSGTGYSVGTPSTATVTISDDDNVLPLPPTNVRASDGTYTDRVEVTWTASDNATAYEVWRHTSDDTNQASRITENLTVTRYDDFFVRWVRLTITG